MVALTENAVNAIRRVIETAQTPPAGLRIMAESAGCSGYRYTMGLDGQVQADDAVLKFGAITLLIDPQSRPALEGAHIDFVDGEDGGGFVIDNPNARTSCGSCQSETC